MPPTARRRSRPPELRPDAIVTDVMMPGLDGFGLVAAIRADPNWRPRRSSCCPPGPARRPSDEGYAGGADDYLPKPFRSKELVDRMAARLSAAGPRARPPAPRRRPPDLVQLDSALQATDSVAGIMDALLESPFGSGDAATVTIGVLDGERPTSDSNTPATGARRIARPLPRDELDTPVVRSRRHASTGRVDGHHGHFRLPPRYEHVVQETAAQRSRLRQPAVARTRRERHRFARLAVVHTA